jgi:hypothetical protein
VALPVSILLQPASFTSLVGGSTKLSVMAAGTGPLTYQWRKAGQNLTGQTGASLVLSPVQLEDAGVYDVVVTNPVGSVPSAPATVLVQDPPVLGSLLNSVTAKAGTSVTFSMTATGTGPLTYQWRRDGTPIPGATALTYTIPMLDESYRGAYDIVVTGPWGSVVSATATLTVLSISTGKPVVMTHPVNATVAWGSSATLSAMVASSKPFRYQWVKVGEPAVIVASGTSAAGTGLVLKYTLAAVKEADEGVYELVLRDENGEFSEATRPGAIRLNIALGEVRLLLKNWNQDLSSLQTDPRATVVLPTLIQRNEVLRVGVKTAAAAKYSWSHRAGNGTITQLPSQKGPTLNFNDVIRLKGYYTLTITTAGVSRNVVFLVLSFVTTSGTATSRGTPVITHEPKALVVPEGAPANFAVTASGDVGRYAWWRRVNGKQPELLSDGASPWLTIDRVSSDPEDEHEADYWVEVFDMVTGLKADESVPVSLDVDRLGD